MLPKSRRLTRRAFPDNRSRGLVSHTEHLSGVFFPNNKENKALFAAVVSKKVLKTAVARHQWKRRVYEAVAHYEKNKTPLRAGSYIFYAKRGVEKLSYKELAQEVREILQGNTSSNA